MSNSVDLYINGFNAREKWGVLTTSQTLGALLAPSSMKPYIKSESRLENGSRILTNGKKVAERSMSIPIQMIADSETQFYARHASFCTELEKGDMTIYTSDHPSVVYKVKYESCPQYTQFNRGIATLSLRVTEPDPTDRSES